MGLPGKVIPAKMKNYIHKNNNNNFFSLTHPEEEVWFVASPHVAPRVMNHDL